MKSGRYILYLLLFLIIQLIIATGIYVIIEHHVSRFPWTNNNSEAVLRVIPEGKSFDFVILGTSHGRIFSRSGNHDRVEKILGRKFFNLSKGHGEGGLVPSLVLLDRFYSQHNSTQTIIYYIDAWVMYSRKWNEENTFLSDEKIILPALKNCLDYKVDAGVMGNYFKSKLSIGYWNLIPDTSTRNMSQLDASDTSALRKRIESLYLEQYDAKVFDHYAALLQDFNRRAVEKGIKVIYIIPSTLLDDKRGERRMINLLQSWQAKGMCSFYDCSKAIKVPHLYYDHDHLNSEGIDLFTRKYLLTIFTALGI